MTTELPSVLLIFDLGALMAGRTQLWLEYEKAGRCYVPEVVFEEIDFLAQNAPTPDHQKVAREFKDFFAESGWAVTDAQETHPAIEPGRAANQSKQTRLVVATAHCVYGFAQENSNLLVVFVSNNQALLKRMQALKAANLCGITGAMLLQWARNGERPVWVSEQLQRMISALNLSGINAYSRLAKPSPSVSMGRAMTPEAKVEAVEREITVASVGKKGVSSAGSNSLLLSLATSKPMGGVRRSMEATPAVSRRVVERGKVVRSRQQDESYYTVQDRRRVSSMPKGPGILSHLMNGVMALGFLMLTVGIGWRTLQPVSFRKYALPVLPPQVRPYLK